MRAEQRYLSPEWTRSALRGLVKSFRIEMSQLETSMDRFFGGNGWRYHPIKTEDFTRAVMDELNKQCIKRICTTGGYITVLRTREKDVFVMNRRDPGGEEKRDPKGAGPSGIRRMFETLH